MVVENAISQAIADTRYLKLAGGEMSGNILMGANGIGNDNPVLTFAAGVSGKATFAGTIQANRLDAIADRVTTGVNDTTPGLLIAYGGGAANVNGGRLLMYCAADHDSAISYYQVRAYEDDLQFARTTSSMLKYQGGAANWLFGAPVDMGTHAISNAGAISGAAITGTSFVIGANTLDTTEWAFLDGQDQALKVADSVEFAQVTHTGTGKAIFNAATEYINGPGSNVLALVTGGTLTLGAAATNQVIVTSTGLTYWIGTGGVPYAEIWVRDNVVETVIGTAGTYVQFVGFTNNGPANNATPDHTQDHITIGHAGVYEVICSLHLEGVAGGAADLIEYEIRTNNGTVIHSNLHGQRQLTGGAGDSGSISISGLADFSAGDTVELWITDDDNATNVLGDDANLSVHQVGG